MKNVCFTGHRNVYNIEETTAKLRQVINECIKKGATDFYAGGAIGWDTICAKEIIELKKENSDIKLHIIFPCNKESQTRKWTNEQKECYDYVLSCADNSEYIADNYYDGCMKKRNAKLVENADLCICYYNASNIYSGTGQTVRMANKKGIEVINIFEG